MTTEVKYYGASWCAPCHSAKPKIQELCKKCGISLSVYDYDELEEEERGTITKLPTVQIWQNKTLEKEIITQHVETLETWISENVRVIPTDDF